MKMKMKIGFIIWLSFLLCISSSSLSASLASSSSGNYKDKVAVLMYHHVHDKDTSSSTISTMQFRDQLIYLKSKGYHFIRLHEFRRFMEGGQVPANAVLVTFDDGYQSFYTFAYPILKELSVPAVNFSITNYFEQDSPQIPHLSYFQINKMMNHSPTIDIQCHTHNLHQKIGEKSAMTYIDKNLGRQASQIHQTRIVEDTSACMNILKKSGVDEADSISYPFGIYSKSLFPLLNKAGIKYGFTTKPGLVTRKQNKLELPRINAGSPGITPQVLHSLLKKRA
ncbi:hypothetical protein A7975_24550 [Bacillus sp. FJAT-26390]|nr:hypothetical protein A7975_24550 [Bacillus sp. FJAT-26390]